MRIERTVDPKAVVAGRRSDAALVMLECLLRHGAILRDAAGYLALDALRHRADLQGTLAWSGVE